MTILVTGGAGYIGGHFVNLLRKTKHKVVVVDNFSEGRNNVLEGVAYFDCDIRDKKKLLEIFKQVKPDIVDHFAACSSISASRINPAELYETNIVGSLNVLECMRAVKCKKIIFMSSAAVYAGEGLVDENSLTKPANPYGKSKLMFEQILEDYKVYGIKAVIFRPFSVGGCDENEEVGCYHKKHWQFFPNLILSFTKKKIWDVHGDGSAVRDFIHVNDVAEAHMLMIRKFTPGTYNLAKGYGDSIMFVIEKATDIIGKEPNYHLSDIKAVPLKLVGDPTRMWQLGWKAKRSIEDMITSEYNFFKTL